MKGSHEPWKCGNLVHHALIFLRESMDTIEARSFDSKFPLHPWVGMKLFCCGATCNSGGPGRVAIGRIDLDLKTLLPTSSNLDRFLWLVTSGEGTLPIFALGWKLWWCCERLGWDMMKSWTWSALLRPSLCSHISLTKPDSVKHQQTA